MNTQNDAKVLVVDDVPANRDLLIRRLQQLGLTSIDQAENGLQALEAIDAKSYDLVMLDIMMPELDGFGVLERLTQNGRINELPVIVISAMSEIEAVVRCVELGAEDFIFKPFNPTLLRARVRSTLEKKLLRDRTRNELRLKLLELNEARTLQRSLMPPRFDASLLGQSFVIDTILEPAKEVGGDLVDHFQVGPGMIVLAIGDVSDKGAGAALMMARTHAMFRGLAGRPDAIDLFRTPERAAEIVNAALAEGNVGCMFVTFMLATYDIAAQELTYVRAGHIPPYHRNAEGIVTRLNCLSGPPLGLDQAMKYKSEKVAVAPGDRLLMVTDGFTEAQDLSGGLYGDRRIVDFMAACPSSDIRPLDRLLEDVRQFEAGCAAADDAAALLLSLGLH